ncbi:hypothetical protein KSS87_002733 [Heliosperma pusillum]|nr:hypothetical protein KSS87_002733 [Heliosperma pusillum]
MNSHVQQILLLEDTLLQISMDAPSSRAKLETGNWKASFFILGSECCDRVAFYAIETNLVSYVIGKLHQGNVSAARIVSTWSGTCFLTPLLGAFIADAYWGRYWTVAVSSIAYFIVISGHSLFILPFVFSI